MNSITKFRALLDILIPESKNQPSGSTVFERRQIIPECEVELANVVQWVEDVLSDINMEAETGHDIRKILRANDLIQWRYLLALIAEVYCGDKYVFEQLYGTRVLLGDELPVNPDVGINELIEPVLANKTKYRVSLG